MKKTKIKSVMLKSLIVIAVVIMLLSVIPDETRKKSETTITYEEIEKWSKTN